MPTGKKTIACQNADCDRHGQRVQVAARQIACDACLVAYPIITKRARAKAAQ